MESKHSSAENSFLQKESDGSHREKNISKYLKNIHVSRMKMLEKRPYPILFDIDKELLKQRLDTVSNQFATCDQFFSILQSEWNLFADDYFKITC